MENSLWSHSKLDDDDVSIDASDVAGLGTIKLSVYGGYLSGNPYVAPAREYREIKIPEKRLIPERGKKGIQQCVGYVCCAHPWIPCFC
jgi:hypothetical protein